MGIAFDAPLALLLLVPALGLTFGLHLGGAAADGHGPAPGRARRPDAPAGGARLRARRASGSSCRSTGWPRSSSSTCPIRSANAGREDALAFVRETPGADARGRRRGDRRVRQGRPRRAAAGRAPRDRPDRLGAGPLGDRHRRRAAARRRRCSRTTPRSGSCCSPTATTRPGEGQSEAALAAARGIQVETRRDRARTARRGPRRAPDDARRRRGSARRSRSSPTSARPSPSRRPSACSPTATQVGIERGRARARARTRSRSDVEPPEAGFVTLPGRRRGRPEHVQPERPGRLEHDRQGRAADPRRGRATRRSRPSSSAALEVERQEVDTIVPEALPTDLAEPGRPTTRSSSSTCRGSALTDRQMAALQVYVRDLGKGLVMIGGPRELRRRRLPEDADRGDAAGRHGRPRPAEAARHRARRRHRQVGLDGRLPLQHVRRRHGRRHRDRRRPEGRHRQGGDPAGRRGDDRARRARRRRLRRVGPLGRPDPAARRDRRPPGPASRASSRSARRTSSPASTRR